MSVRTDHHQSIREFVWPRITEFNFALDRFHQLAADPAEDRQ